MVCVDDRTMRVLYPVQEMSINTRLLKKGEGWCPCNSSQPHPCAGQVKRHPQVETLPVTRDSRTEVTKRILKWLVEGPIWASRALLLNNTLHCWMTLHYSVCGVTRDCIL